MDKVGEGGCQKQVAKTWSESSQEEETSPKTSSFLVKILMMFKLQVITPLFVMFVLQVFSQEASQPKLSCASLCEQVGSGYAGICCGRY